jgi:polyferredoxin
MLRKIRIILAVVCFMLITMLFLNFTGIVYAWLGWLAKIQLLPAILSINIVVIALLAILTLLFGRVYCSVICPLGVLQDGISCVAGKRKKNRFRYSPAKSRLRYGILGLFIIAIILKGSALVSLLDPYAAYGRVAANFFAPVYRWGNNLLGWLAERMDSYAFYSTEIWVKGWITFGTATVTLIAVGLLARRGGRTYCNTICPVGSALGLLSRFAIFRPAFDAEKCKKCGLCERNCKASCINVKNLTIDKSRCVACFKCM